jgi:hypothetical protein
MGGRALYPAAALLAVGLVFVALASVVAVKTPAWESSDEPDHAQNVETLVAGHWYRIPDALWKGNRSPAPGEVATVELHQPPLYYLLLAGFQRLVGEPARAVKPGPGAFPYFANGRYQHHGSAQSRFLLLLRFANVCLGLLTIMFTFLTARLLSRDRWTPVIAAAIVAFMPKFVFLSPFVENDNLVNILGAALAYAAVRCTIFPTRWWTAAVGGLIGLLIITKLSALPAIAVLAPVVMASGGWARRGQVIAIAFGAMIVICAWYLVQNDVRYGDPLAITASQRYLQLTGGLGTFGAPYVVADPLRLVFADLPSRIWTQFWYTSDWEHRQWPATTSLVFWVALAASLAGLRGRKGSGNLLPRSERTALTALIVLAGAGIVSVYSVAFNSLSYSSRLALVGLPALACLAALGVERWKLPVRLVLPLLELVGTVVAIQQDVLGVDWSH